MGEYYYPVLFAQWTDAKKNVKKTAVKMFYSHGYKVEFVGRDGRTYDFGEGLKMMEHCYFGGKMVNHVLAEVEKYSKKLDCSVRLGWVSDYACHLEITEEALGDKYEFYRASQSIVSTRHLRDALTAKPTEAHPSNMGFILNPVRNEYITVFNHRFGGDLNNSICPLPLLTQFNEGGGGNYIGAHEELLGTWCFDELKYTKKRPEMARCLDKMFWDEHETI